MRRGVQTFSTDIVMFSLRRCLFKGAFGTIFDAKRSIHYVQYVVLELLVLENSVV